MTSILKLSAFEIARAIKKKEISPLEAVQTHIDYVEKVNPNINAVVEKLYDEALALAKIQTEQIARLNAQAIADLPQLFGVPFTIKEMIAHKGSRRTGGSYHKKDAVMDFDGSIVQRMKAAGAIPIATTNVPELGFWVECYNAIYGMTNNPHNNSHTPGGSSGGEAALIAAGASPFGLGSDIGGSIRMPSAFCGIYGHKPSNRIVPITGHFPYAIEDIRKLKGGKYPYTTLGPMARKAQDLYPLLKLMIGPDGVDQETLNDFKLKERSKNFSQVKVYYISAPEIFLARGASAEVSETVELVAQYFKDLGCKTEALRADVFSKAGLYWSSALKSTKEKTFEQNLTNEKGLFFIKEIVAMGFKKSIYTFPSLGISAMERMLGFIKKKDSSAILLELENKIKEINSLLGDNAVLIMPTFPSVAPKHYHAIFRPLDFLYTAIVNALQMPATSAHVRMNKKGLPIGVQIVGAQFNDHLTLACAEEIEKGFAGWQAPLG
ncbi:MAG: amidase [Bdellovibrionota bacterium]